MFPYWWQGRGKRGQHPMPRQRETRWAQRSARLLLEALENRCLLSYSLLDLGTAPGYPDSAATSVNNAEQVVGYATDNRGYPPHRRALLWESGQLTDLGTLGGRTSFASGINDGGQVVGYAYVSDNPVDTFHAFRWENGRMTDLGTLRGGLRSSAAAINASGQVAGSATDGSGGPQEAVLWQDGQTIGLGTFPDGFHSGATAINASGQIVGWSELENGYVIHPFLWDATHGLRDLYNFLRTDIATGINDAGQVIGGSRLLSDGQVTDLGNLGYPRTTARAVNNLGQVVGDSYLDFFGPDHAFLYQDGFMEDLNDLVPPDTGLTVVRAYAISDAGQIVGEGSDADQHLHAVLLTPDNGAAARRVEPGIFKLPVTVPEVARIGEKPMPQPSASAVEERVAVETVPPPPAGALLRRATEAVFANSPPSRRARGLVDHEPAADWESLRNSGRN